MKDVYISKVGDIIDILYDQSYSGGKAVVKEVILKKNEDSFDCLEVQLLSANKEEIDTNIIYQDKKIELLDVFVILNIETKQFFEQLEELNRQNNIRMFRYL
jgi:hypothetical protein